MVDDFDISVEQAAIALYVFNDTANRWQSVATGQFVANAQVVAEMRLHVAATFNTLDVLTTQLYSGAISMEQWQIAVAAELKDAHLAQSMYAVGGQANMTAVEYGRVGGTLADEYRYLANFADDIAAGRVSEAQALARIKQYGKATQQSYWREYAVASPGKIYWDTHPADHCKASSDAYGCLDLEAASPYTADTLPTTPGAGATTCRGNCNCTLRRES